MQTNCNIQTDLCRKFTVIKENVKTCAAFDRWRDHLAWQRETSPGVDWWSGEMVMVMMVMVIVMVMVVRMIVVRLEICRDRHDRRSCKKISSCVIFSKKQRNSLQICEDIWNSLDHLECFHTTFLQNYWNFTFYVNFNNKKEPKSLILKFLLFYRW